MTVDFFFFCNKSTLRQVLTKNVLSLRPSPWLAVSCKLELAQSIRLLYAVKS